MLLDDEIHLANNNALNFNQLLSQCTCGESPSPSSISTGVTSCKTAILLEYKNNHYTNFLNKVNK